MKNPIVAIVRIRNNDYDAAIKEIFSLLGGVNRIIPALSRVMLKANWVTNKHYTSGAVTNTKVLNACCNILLRNAVKSITICDSAMIGQRTEDVIKTNEVDSLISKRVSVVDLRKEDFIKVPIPNALLYHRLSFPKTLFENDIVINVPVMKTHESFPATLGLKNMKGLLPDIEKKRLHTSGLIEGVIDLNRVALPDLTIIDGSIGMEGNGPVNGTPVNAGILIASLDALAAEVVALTVMGINTNLEYIRLAYEAGFGEKDIDNILVLGENLNDVIRPFKTNFFDEKRINNLTIHDEFACSGCKDCIVQLKLTEETNFLKPMSIYAGVLSQENIDKECGNIKIGIGQCLYKNKKDFDVFVGGCPPTKQNVLSVLKNTISADG